MATSTSPERWAEFGQWMKVQRQAAGLKAKHAAQAAGVSYATWRALEAGGTKVGGEWVPPNPAVETLVAVARALTVPPSEVLERAGHEVPRGIDSAFDAQQRALLRTLEERLNTDRSGQFREAVRSVIEDTAL